MILSKQWHFTYPITLLYSSYSEMTYKVGSDPKMVDILDKPWIFNTVL